jgi:hypothetical protein
MQLGNPSKTSSCQPTPKWHTPHSNPGHSDHTTDFNPMPHRMQRLSLGLARLHRNHRCLEPWHQRGSHRRIVRATTDCPSFSMAIRHLPRPCLFNNPIGAINNSGQEMVGLLFLWLCIEAIAPDIAHKHIMLISDNSPTVSWVDKIALQRLRITAQLVRTLALQLNINKTCPLTPEHIPGV